MKKTTNLLIRILALVLICAMVLPFAACRKDPQPNQDPTSDPAATKKTYTVQVESAGGMALAGVGVYIYEDETLSELVWFDQTGADGAMTFTDVERNSYVAVLSDVPTGYAVADFYPITGDTTKIVLEAGQMGEDVQNITYKLGDMVMDFTLTDADGTEYTLSQLLQQKKAVVLNFWYIECGPCNAEFPYLQEAYEQYADQIALLALNPINTPEDIAAFRTEKGYTFPMLSCGMEWEKLFGITAYPTTIVIDRFGNICLIHRGTIDTAKTFADTFAYFVAEDYEQKLIDDIHSLETEAEAGTADNPNEIGGLSSFQITVDPGKEVYTQLYKARGMYMSIKGPSKDFYVFYNDKKYTPDSSGTVGFVISTGDNYTPALFAIGNTGTQQQTFQVNLGHLAGTFNNPYDLKLGEFTAKVSAGNEQGICYLGTAPEDGTFIVQCIEAPAGVEYDFSLQSMDVNKTILRNYRGDGSADNEEGYPTVTMTLPKGTDMMFSVGTLPDESNSYPGGTFRFLVTFQEGELKEEEKEEKLDYTVTVLDENDQPLQDVTIWLSKEKETFSGKTDALGIVTLNLIKDTYSGIIGIPEGYTLENNAFELTPEAPTLTIKLAPAVDTRLDYTVTVQNVFGEPVEGTEIFVLGVGSAVTDANGVAVFKLEPGNYTVFTGTVPEGMTCTEVLTLTEETVTGTLTLEFLPGTENNPILITEADSTVTNSATIWYAARFSGATAQITGQPGFTVQVNGQTLTDVDGTVSWEVFSDSPFAPETFAVTGEGDYRVTFTYPVGHQMNPDTLLLGQNAAQREAGDTEYYYTWTAIGDGKLTVTMQSNQWVYTLSNQTAGQFGDTHWSDDETPAVSQTIQVSAGDVIQLTVNTYDSDDMFQAPAGTVTFLADFTWIVEQIPFTTAVTPAGSWYYYEITGASGRVLVIDDADAYVIYGNTTYGPDSTGKVRVELDNQSTTLLAIGNSGKESESFDVTFDYPLGHPMNPDLLGLGAAVIFCKAGQTPYYYTWTAPGNGKLTVTMQSEQWAYSLSNLSAGIDGQIYTSSDETPVASQTIQVSAGDVIQLAVNTSDSSSTSVSMVEFQVDFVWVVEEIPFTTAQIPAGEAYTYEIHGAGGLELSIQDPDAAVIIDLTRYSADETGKVTVQLKNMDSHTVTICNEGTQAESYEVTFGYPVGHAMKPDQLNLGFNDARRRDGDTPYYYTWTAPGNGKLTITMDTGMWCYTLSNLTAGVAGQTHSSTDETPLATQTILVSTGDQIRLTVSTADPAVDGTVSFSADFVWVAEEVPFTTAQIPAGEQYVYEITGASGLLLNIQDPDVTVIYGATLYTADETGKILVQLGNESPNLVYFRNEGAQAESYDVTVTYPVGHAMNPGQLRIDFNTAYCKAGDTGYYYTWTAPGNGNLTVTMSSGDWSYSLSNLTAGVTGQTHTSADAIPVAEQTIFVKAGDVIQLIVSTYDAANSAVTPAGNVICQADFVWVVEEIPFTTAQIPAGGHNVYDIHGAAEATLTIESQDAYVFYDSYLIQPDETGKVTVQLGQEDVIRLHIGNNGTAPASFDVAFSWPEGHKKNPKVLSCGNQSVLLPLNETYPDGYYCTMTSTVMGTVTFSTPAAPVNAEYVLILSRNGEAEVITSAAGNMTRTVAIYAFPGDVLLLQLKPQPGIDGTYPTVDIAVQCRVEDDNATQTVTFDPNGGTLTGAATAQTEKGRLPAMPTAPVRPDYTFLGWFDAPTGGNPVTINTTYRTDTTVYAQWSKLEYQVTFDPCGGSLAGESVLSTMDYRLAALPTPTREYHSFIGWFDAPTGGNPITTDKLYTANTTVYAQWSKVEYQVTFDLGGGTLTGSATVTTTDRQLSSLPTPFRSGYTFTGWYDAATGGKKITAAKIYTANTTIYAQWSRIEYQVTFNLGGGTLIGSTTVTTTGGKLSSLPTPTRSGYTFAGWYDAATGGNQITADKTYTMNTTIYAQWSKNEYKVTFNLGGGSLDGSTTATTVNGKLSSLPTPTRDDYTFTGWFDAPNGGNKITTDKVYTANATIYAQWSRNEYQVTFDPNGGSLDGNATETTVNGKLISLPTPTRSGYTFTGWFDASTGGSKITTGKVYTANTTIYAQWNKIEYQVTFNLAGGSLTGSTTVTTTDCKLSSLPAPTKEGHTFDGWYDTPTGGNEITTDRIYTANTTIYAQWTEGSVAKIPYKVTVLDSTGQPVSGNVTVTWQGSTGFANKTVSDASGVVTAKLLPGSYKVILTFSGALADCKAEAVTVTEAAPDVTIQIAKPIAEDAPVTDIWGEYYFKEVGLGTTYVELNNTQSTYAVVDGKEYCFFYFTIPVAANYKITTTNGAPVSSWGTGYFFNAGVGENNTIVQNVTEDMFYEGLTQYFSVEVTADHPNTIIQITDGEIERNVYNAPYIQFEGTQTPKVNYVNGKATAIAENIFKLDPQGKTLTYVDMLNDKPVLGDDGYYHLGTKDGPILYVTLGTQAPYYSLATVTGAVGQFGTSFVKVFYNEDGTPEMTADGAFRKESYTDALIAYCVHVDPTYGVYPLNEDLAYMILHGGEQKGWYTPGSGTYLFEEEVREVDLELVWMFAVCYLK